MISLWSASCVLARVICPSSDGIRPLFSIEYPLKGPAYDRPTLDRALFDVRTNGVGLVSHNWLSGVHVIQANIQDYQVGTVVFH